MHRGRRRGRADELGADAQGPAAAGCLDGARAPLAARDMRGAKHHLFDSAVEFLSAGGGHVGFRGLGREHDLLGAAHALEYRGVAAQVAIHTDAEIDFLRECIGAKFRHQSEDGVGVQAVDMLKQVFMPPVFADHIIGHAVATSAAIGPYLALGPGRNELDRAGQSVESDPAVCRRGARHGARGRGRRACASRGSGAADGGLRAGSIRPPRRSFRCRRSTTIRTAVSTLGLIPTWLVTDDKQQITRSSPRRALQPVFRLRHPRPHLCVSRRMTRNGPPWSERRSAWRVNSTPNIKPGDRATPPCRSIPVWCTTAAAPRDSTASATARRRAIRPTTRCSRCSRR